MINDFVVSSNNNPINWTRGNNKIKTSKQTVLTN